MKRHIILLILSMTIITSSCGVYSFTGASIPEGAKTVSVKYFKNVASMVQPTLSNVLTETLQNRFNSQTSLSMVDKNGDLSFEGEITNYTISPVAFQANETSALNRLTITINVKFSNKIDPKQDFETSFSRYADFDRSKNLNQVEDELIKQITEALVDDIFNKSVVNW